jgi:hypothetical protein
MYQKILTKLLKLAGCKLKKIEIFRDFFSIQLVLLFEMVVATKREFR